jgi:hypothetical protein
MPAIDNARLGYQSQFSKSEDKWDLAGSCCPLLYIAGVRPRVGGQVGIDVGEPKITLVYRQLKNQTVPADRKAELQISGTTNAQYKQQRRRGRWWQRVDMVWGVSHIPSEVGASVKHQAQCQMLDQVRMVGQWWMKQSKILLKT